MTLREAAHSLYEHLGMPRSDHPWLQSIGEADTTQTIYVMMARKPRPHEQQCPERWEGFRVESKVVGRIRIGGR